MLQKIKKPLLAEQIRFNLFELGIYLSEQQSQFHYFQAIQQINRHQSQPSVRHKESLILKLALINAYRHFNHARIQKHKLTTAVNNSANVSNIKNQIAFEQLACPSINNLIEAAQTQPLFSTREFLNFNAPFSNQVHLLWHAVHKDLVQTTFSTITDNFQKDFPRELALWYEALYQKRICPSEYIPMPVHPWHYQHIFQLFFKEAISEKKIIGPLFRQTTYPGINPFCLTTQNAQQPFIRFSRKNHLNSCPHALSKLKNILRKEKSGNQPLRVMFDNYKLALKHSGANFENVFTASTGKEIKNDELAIPVPSLINSNTETNTPLLIEVLIKQALKPEIFFQQLHTLLSNNQIKLAEHKLDIKAPQEDVFLIFRNSQLTGVAYRSPTVTRATSSGLRMSHNNLTILKQVQSCLRLHTL